MEQHTTKISSWALLGILLLAQLSTACQYLQPKGELEACVDSFTHAFFNWRFNEACTYCTPASRKWLAFAASNVSEADIDALRSQPADIDYTLLHISYEDAAHTSAIVQVRIDNAIQADSLGGRRQMEVAAHYSLRLVHTHQGWKVDLDGLPRPDKP